MKKVILSVLVASALFADSYVCERVGLKISDDLGLYSYLPKTALVDVNETNAVLTIVGGMNINGDLKVTSKENYVTFIDRDQKAAITIATGKRIYIAVAKGGLNYAITDCRVK